LEKHENSPLADVDEIKNSLNNKKHERDLTSPLSFVSSNSPQSNANKTSEGDDDEEVCKINEKRPRSSRSPLSIKPSSVSCPNEDEINKNKLDENLPVNSKQNQNNDAHENENKENHQEKNVETNEHLNDDIKSPKSIIHNDVVLPIKEEVKFNEISNEKSLNQMIAQPKIPVILKDSIENVNSILMEIKVENSEPDIKDVVVFQIGKIISLF
jgi:hypothetical protein